MNSPKKGCKRIGVAPIRPCCQIHKPVLVNQLIQTPKFEGVQTVKCKP